jgi:hypothetical protein
VGGILFLTAGFVLYRSIVRFDTANDDLKRVKLELSSYYEAPIFPSAENVEQELENARQVDVWFAELMETLGQGNVNSAERSPSKFIGILEKVRNRLIGESQKAGTELPSATQSFAFGFDRYSGTGTLPKPQDVPRLMEQLAIINRLCTVMFKNRIKGISTITRDGGASDAPVANARRRRGRPGKPASPQKTVGSPSARPGVIGEGALFAKLHFVFEFRAKESALVTILNDLASSSIFIAVTSLSVSKPSPEFVPAAVDPEAERTARSEFGGARPSAAAQPKTHNLGPNAPICGIKMEIPMDIRLELDVYKFREAAVDSGD